MLNINFKHLFYAACIFLLASIAGLWSWNTLSEIFNWPLVQYRHVLAIFILLIILKWGLFSNHQNYKHRKISPAGWKEEQISAK